MGRPPAPAPTSLRGAWLASPVPPPDSPLPTDGKSCSLSTKASSGVGSTERDAIHKFKYDGILEGTSQVGPRLCLPSPAPSPCLGVRSSPGLPRRPPPQEDVYSTVAEEIVENVIGGYNGTVFCYGQTGAGKTYTMSGNPAAYQHRGIVPRAIAQIFREVDMRVEKEFTVRVSYLEIYNESMYDLLSSTPGAGPNLTVTTEGGVTSVRGLSQVVVASEEEALAQFFQGESMRTTSEHVLNAASSRSHCVFTVHVEATNAGGQQERAVCSKINLVDLAGSERSKKTDVRGQTLKEASYINKSLTFLEQVVQALVKRASHVPYRQSKLTAVLRDALGGNNKAAMVANVWPEPQNQEETLATLRFASRVRLLENDAVVNESTDPSFVIKKQERVIRELKQELAMRDTLAGRGVLSYDDMSDADIADLQGLVKRYLDGDADEAELPLDTLKRIKEAYRQFRSVFMTIKGQLESRILTAQRSAPAAGDGQADPAAAAGGDPAGAEGTVGDIDLGETTGFHVGTAPLGARPSTTIEEAQAPPKTPHQESRAGASRPATGGRRGSPSHAGSVAGGPPEAAGAAREEAYYRFKHEVAEGRALNGEVKALQERFQRVKAELKRQVTAVNEHKRQMDEVQGGLDERRRENGGGDVIDEDEWRLLGRLKEIKGQYRHAFDEVKRSRAQADGLADQLAGAREQLVTAFQGWYRGDADAGGAGRAAAGVAFDVGGEDERDENVPAEESDAFWGALRTHRGQKAPGRRAAGGAATTGQRAIGEAIRKQERQLRAMAL